MPKLFMPIGAEQQVSTTSQALDLSFLAGLNPELYQSLGQSLGIFNNNGERSHKCINYNICVLLTYK